jgi:TonB-dependent starch-binding outer membrane protein SusC
MKKSRLDNARYPSRSLPIKKQNLTNFMLTVFVLVVSSFQVQATDSVGLEKISLEKESATVKTILKEIEKQSDLRFFYNSRHVDVKRKVTVHFKDAAIKDVIEEIFRGTSIAYKFSGRQILLYQPLTSGQASEELPQENNPNFAFTVSGLASDDAGQPLPGVNILEKGTTNGTTTDSDGKYRLTVADGNTILIFSFIGYATQEIPLNNQTTLNVSLAADIQSLQEIVVIGYGSVEKKDLSGSVTSVSMKGLQEVSLPSFDQMLTGRAGGVQINQSNGQAGAGTSIRIRGGNSLNGTNEPLFVIDGFPIINDNAAFAASGPLGLTNSGSGNSGQGNPNGALNWLNPADILSVEVLKDASATAIYGSRGANGVIIVTTKRGKSGDAKLNFSASYGLNQFNDSKIELMNGSEYATYRNLYNQEYNIGRTPAEQVPIFYTGTTIGGVFYPEASQIGVGTNWIDAVTRTGATRNYSVDFSGGKDVLYSGSVGWLDQETPLLGSQFKRANFRLNLVTDLTPWLKLDNTTSYSQSTADNSPSDIRDVQKFGLFEAALAANPAEPVYKADGSLNFKGGVPDSNNPAIAFNPISLANDVLNRNTVQTFLNNLSLKATVARGLTFEARGSVFKNDLLRDIYYDSKTTFVGNQVGGLAGKNSNNSSSYLFETFGNYGNTFGKNEFTALAGYSYQTTSYRTLTIGASNFTNNTLRNENLSAGSTQYPTQSSRIEDLLTSYFVRLNNVLSDKYIFTFTARYDGSSKFAEGNKWSFFPSGAFSWRLSQEDFLSSVKPLSDLKLRVSYGLSGNQAVASLQTKSTLANTQYPYGGVLQTGVLPGVLENKNLTWETTSQLNIGLDFGLWNQRVSGAINYYEKNTNDLLQYLPLPANSGYSSQLANVGSISNKGIEVELRANIVNKGGFKWDINANFASNKQTLTDLGRGGIDTLLVRFDVVGGSIANVALIKGQPVGLFYGNVSNGIFRTAQELADGPSLPGSKVGTRRFKDLNSDGQINDKDRQVLGDPNPAFIFGVSNSVSFKNFDLNFLVQGSVGGEMWNLSDYVQERLGNRSKAANDYFTPTNINAKYPAPGQVVGRENHSDFSVQDASFVRLKSVTLGYNLPAKSLRFVKSVRLYASATNLFTFTGYDGYDPEVNSFAQSNLFRNIDILTMPLFKTYTFGLNIGL